MFMEYTVVNLKEMKIEGLSAVTKNSDPDMPCVISGLWGKFYEGGICQSISNKVNEKAVEIYSDYESDVNGKYKVTVGCEVSQFSNRKDLSIKTIPEGKYAKFIVKGHMIKAVQEFWQKLWEMDLDRSYKCDFEEYQNSSIDNAVIHIYISIN